MTKYIFTLILTITSFYSFSQKSNGYFGAKYFTTIETILNKPVAYNVIEYGGGLDNFKVINYGYRLTLGYIVKRNFAVCFETGVNNDKVSNIWMTDSYTSNSQSSQIPVYKHFQNMETQTLSIMPKIEITNSKGLIPLGFSSQFGIGYSKTRFKENAYNYKLEHQDNNNYYYNSVFVKDGEGVYQFKNDSTTPNLTTITLLYAFSLRTALTKKLLLNYGFRFTLNYSIPQNGVFGDLEGTFGDVGSITDSFPGSDATYFNSSTLERKIMDQKRNNFLQFNLGLTYAF